MRQRPPTPRDGRRGSCIRLSHGWAVLAARSELQSGRTLRSVRRNAFKGATRGQHPGVGTGLRQVKLDLRKDTRAGGRLELGRAERPVYGTPTPPLALPPRNAYTQPSPGELFLPELQVMRLEPLVSGTGEENALTTRETARMLRGLPVWPPRHGLCATGAPDGTPGTGSALNPPRHPVMEGTLSAGREGRPARVAARRIGVPAPAEERPDGSAQG